MTTPTDTRDQYDRPPTADEAAGLAWWNALTVAERRRWMEAAGNSGVVADAWAAYKRTRAPN